MAMNYKNAERRALAGLPSTERSLLNEEDELRQSLVPTPDFTPLLERAAVEAQVAAAQQQPPPAPAQAPASKATPYYLANPDAPQPEAPPAPSSREAYPVAVGPDSPDHLKAQAMAYRLQNRNALGAGLMRGAETISSAISGRKADYGFADKADKDATLPLHRAKEEAAYKQADYEKKLKAHELDPAHPKARAFQDSIVSSGLADKIFGNEANLRGMNIDSINKRVAQWKESENLRLTQEQRDETLRHNKEGEKIDRFNANKPPAQNNFLLTRDIIATEKEDASRQQLGKETKKLAGYGKALMDMDKVMPGITDGATSGVTADGKAWDIKKQYGTMDRALLSKWAQKWTAGASSQWVSESAKELGLPLAQGMELLMRSRTGAVINDSEYAAQYDALFTRVLADPTQLPEALAELKSLHYAELRSLQKGYEGGRVNPMETFEGYRYDNPFFAKQLEADGEVPVTADEIRARKKARSEAGAPPQTTSSTTVVKTSGPAAPTDAPPPGAIASAKQKLKPGEALIYLDGKLQVITDPADIAAAEERKMVLGRGK
jgi:hypothetical protein